MHKLSLLEILNFINESINIINKRFNAIDNVDDFTKSDIGLQILDSIILRIQAIGEALKNIDKFDRKILLKINTRDYWSNIIKLRDLISHHYLDIDGEVIYMICDEKLEELQANIKRSILIVNNSQE